MKTKFLLLPLLTLSFVCLTGCNTTSKIKPTFGSDIDQTFTDLTYSELFKKNQEQETMIVFTYPGKDTHCSCWKEIELYMLPKLAKETEYLVYAVDAYEIERAEETYNLVIDLESPSIVFFKGGKKVDQFVYSVRNTQPFFKKYDALLEFLDKYTLPPQYIYTDVENLKVGIENEEEYIAHYTYHSCPDCSYCLPNVMYSYLEKNDLDVQIHLLNLETEEEFLTNGKIDSSKQEYIDFKNQYGLSSAGNETYGYGRGYVPTIQYYKSGVLEDASVYFNDTVSEVDGQYKITSTFYTEARRPSLKYLSGVTNPVLEGLIIPQEDLTIYEEYDYIVWSHASANKYHKPLLEAFLNYYCK